MHSFLSLKTGVFFAIGENKTKTNPSLLCVSGAVHRSDERGCCGGDSVRTESHRYRYVSLWHRGLLPTTILAAHWQQHTHSCLRWDAHTWCSDSRMHIDPLSSQLSVSLWVYIHSFSLTTESCPEQGAERQIAQSDEEEDDETTSVNIPVVVLVMLIIFVLIIIIYFQVRAL